MLSFEAPFLESSSVDQGYKAYLIIIKPFYTTALSLPFKNTLLYINATHSYGVNKRKADAGGSPLA